MTLTPGRVRADYADSQLSLSVHVAALCRSGYYRLRQLRPAVRSLTADAANTI